MIRAVFAGRRALLWLLGPPVLFLAAVPLVNQVQPVVLGLPLFIGWMIVATLLTPVFIWAAARGDPVRRADRAGTDPGPESRERR